MSAVEGTEFRSSILDGERIQVSEDLGVPAAELVAELNESHPAVAAELMRVGMNPEFLKFILSKDFAEKIGQPGIEDEIQRMIFADRFTWIGRTGSIRRLNTITRFATSWPIARGLWKKERAQRTKELQNMALTAIRRFIKNSPSSQH